MPYSIYALRYELCTACSILFTVYCMRYTVPCTLYTMYHTLYCILYTVCYTDKAVSGTSLEKKCDCAGSDRTGVPRSSETAPP